MFLGDFDLNLSMSGLALFLCKIGLGHVDLLYLQRNPVDFRGYRNRP